MVEGRRRLLTLSMVVVWCRRVWLSAAGFRQQRPMARGRQGPIRHVQDAVEHGWNAFRYKEVDSAAKVDSAQPKRCQIRG